MKNSYFVWASLILFLSALNIAPVLADIDVIAPGAIADLVVTNKTHNYVTLTWTAPGDDGNLGQASKYDIRFSTTAILTDADFDNAVKVMIEPAPETAGTVQSIIVSSGYSAGIVYRLAQNTQYFFAMKTIDEVGNVPPLSNFELGKF